MKLGDKEFVLYELVPDGRGGQTAMPYDTYRLWKDAKYHANRALKDRKWVIQKCEIVAMYPENKS